MAVFHRIEMNVIHMSGKVPFVSDEVFPIPALPDAAFSFARPAGAPAFPLGDMPREPRFDEHPPSGVVRVTKRQSPHRMQMFRQNHHGVDSEGMPFFHYADNRIASLRYHDTMYNVGVRSSPQPTLLATQTGMTNQWRADQDLLSVKDLWYPVTAR